MLKDLFDSMKFFFRSPKTFKKGNILENIFQGINKMTSAIVKYTIKYADKKITKKRKFAILAKKKSQKVFA